MKSSKFMGKMEEIKVKMNSSITKKCCKSQRSEVIKGFDWKIMFALPCTVQLEKTIFVFAGSSLVSSIFQREGKLQCSLTGRKLWSQVKKMLTSSYLRTGVRKYRFCSSGSIGLIKGKHVRYVIIIHFVASFQRISHIVNILVSAFENLFGFYQL